MLRASAVVELAGIPSVSMVSSGFVQLARVVSKGLGVELPMTVYPGPPMVDSLETVREKVEQHLLPGIIAGLTTPPRKQTADSRGAAEPRPGEIVYSGDLFAVQEHFHRQLWTDGMPVMPPTRDAVQRFLGFTDRKPDEVIAVLPQESREATILSISVNGVMAGCRPEYMPVLVAIVEAMADPKFRIEDAGSTPSWEPLVIVSGPISRQLGLNHGQGVMKVGRQANTSIGRFVRLYLRNVCGYRIPPGDGDKGSIGFTFNVALAEDEAAARKIGWPTFGMDQGFGPDENVVSVTSVVCITPPTYSAGADALSHARQFVAVMGRTFSLWAFSGMRKGEWLPVIVISPAVAEVIAREWSKDDLRRYFWEHATLPASVMQDFAIPAGGIPLDLEDLVAKGILPPHYVESDDPERPLRIVVAPEHIAIIVAGDPGRNQSRGYVPNHNQGSRTSRRVALPADWEQRLSAAQPAGRV